MDEVKDQVNWSAVARDAFEAKLSDIARSKELEMDDKAVTRLRQSKEAFQAKERESGKECGREWATNKADYEELVNLNRSLEDHGHDYDEWMSGVDDPTAWIMSVIDGEPGGYNFHRDEQDSLWGSIKDPGADFVAGFAEGAIEVFDKV